ncbi:MAG: TolC family protein [Pirellulaceae bacterium]
MNRPMYRLVALLLIMLLTATGCSPTQPFYLHEDGDLSHYVATVTEMENPDVEQISLEEVTQARPPLTLSDAEFNNFRDVTLEECVSIALQNSKVIRNLGSLTQFTIADGLVGRTGGSMTVYDPAVFESDPQYGVEAALSEFDAQFSTKAFWESTDRPQNSVTAPLLRRDSGQFSADLSKRTATGTTFAVGNETIYDFNKANEINAFETRALPSDWTTIMSVRATQPLLRGNGAQVNRAPLILARIRTDIALSEFEAAVRNMLLDLENSYWDLQFAYRFLETGKIGRDSALITWRQQYELTEGGAGTSQEEAQSREQYFYFRSQMETALRDLFVAENRLRWLMGISPTDGELLRPIDRPTLANVQYDWQAVHAESLVRSAELRRQRWQVKQRETELILARNQLLPQLDVVGRYSFLGMGQDLITASRNGLDYPDEGSTAWEGLTDGNYQEFSFGLEFTPPRIGARKELSGVRNSELALARERARLEDMELNVSHLLTTAIQNLDYNYQVAQTHFNRWVAAEKEVDALMALVKGGKGTVDLVLNGQRRRANAQADFYRAIVEHNKAIANIHFRKGSLLEYNNIQLAEGPWPKKAYWDALGKARERDASYYLDYGHTRPRVISRGPVDQGTGTPGLIEETTPGSIDTQPGTLDMESVPTPEPNAEEMQLEGNQGRTSGTGPSILDGPSLSLNDEAPAELLAARQMNDPWDSQGAETGSGIRPVAHTAPAAKPSVSTRR